MSSSTLIQFCLCLLMFSHAVNGLIRIDLKRMDSPIQTMLKQNIHYTVIEEMLKVHQEDYQNQNNLLDKTAPIPLFRFLDSEFYGEVLIGHPGQKFNVIYDTLWSSSWVPSVLCPVVSMTCAFRHKYNGDKSSKSTNTFRRFNIAFGRTNLTGGLWKDLFHLNQINVTDQVFGAVSEIPWVMMFSKADGVVGLSEQKKTFNNTVPLLYNLITQNKIDKQVFSIYMNRDTSSSSGGTLFFGGTEKRHYKPPFTFIKVEQGYGYWAFKADKLTLNYTEEYCPNGCIVAADTSTNFITGPSKEIDAINKYIGAEYLYLGYYVVSCSTARSLPHITFTFIGQKFMLKGKDYVLQMNTGAMSICISAFKKTKGLDNMWFLGGVFMAKYYLTFDIANYRVGLAEALL